MSTIAAPYRALVDDAAIFPPGDAPLPDAVAAHRRHRRAAYADLLGPFVVSDVRLPDLIELLRGAQEPDGAVERPGGGRVEPRPLAVSVVVTGGAGAIEPAVRWATRADELELRGIELRLRGEDDLAHNARRMTTAVDQLAAAGELSEDLAVHVEPPRTYGAAASPSWLAALDEVAAADLRLKFRTGGVDADDFPAAEELAACIGAALDRELPFKCTAGLHHAVRHQDHEGFDRAVDQHGFLNVLLATRGSLDGLDQTEVAGLLEERDPRAVTERLETAGPGALVSARRWFTSIGSCSVAEPLADLVALDLLPAGLTSEIG